MDQNFKSVKSLGAVSRPYAITPRANEQQMLAQALRGRSIMPQQQLTEQERMMVIELVRQGMNEQQAMQQVMSMRNN
jgi:hypothetical protein